MNNLLPGRTFSGLQFTVDAAQRVLLSESSDLGVRAHELPFGRIYTDACDVGCTIIGNRSTARFYLSEEQRDSDNDIVAWEFKPTPETERSQPALRGWRVIIVND